MSEWRSSGADIINGEWEILRVFPIRFFGLTVKFQWGIKKVRRHLSPNETFETIESIVMAADNARQRRRNGLSSLNGLNFRMSAGAAFLRSISG